MWWLGLALIVTGCAAMACVVVAAVLQAHQRDRETAVQKYQTWQQARDAFRQVK
jgi:hypothetical protein